MSDRPPPRRPEELQSPPGTAPVSPARSVGAASGAVETPHAAGRRAEPRRAVALSYDPTSADAPVVTAAGQGMVAEEIIRRAREAGVPVTEDPRLAAVLSQIDVGRVIPPELYQVIAEVLAYVYRLDERVSRRRGQVLGER
jgi:flagellar biosynthesis protein